MAIARIIRATNAYDTIPVSARNRIIWWTRRFARDIERWIQAEMRKPKHGAWYMKPDGVTPHRASAPGEVPAIWSGALYGDLAPRYSNGGMRAVINPTVTSPLGAPYPTFLEQGTRNMAARPYMKPGFNRYRELYKAKIRQIITETAKLS